MNTFEVINIMIIIIIIIKEIIKLNSLLQYIIYLEIFNSEFSDTQQHNWMLNNNAFVDALYRPLPQINFKTSKYKIKCPVGEL